MLGYNSDSQPSVSAQAYLLLGDEAYLRMFAALYGAAMRHLRPGSPGWPAERGWLGEVHMHSGAVTRPWISALSAFWPGLQALIGAPSQDSSEVLLGAVLTGICALAAFWLGLGRCGAPFSAMCAL